MKKILYLEDELNIQDVVAEYLMTSGYQVDCVSDGQEAFHQLEKTVYDLAVLDIMVPKVNGIDVLKQIKQYYPDIATIMLTALDDEHHQIQAFDLFADDYIIKPFSPVLLLKRIEAILRRVKGVSTQDNIEVLDKSYQVYYQQKSLNLTITEFLIFQVLYRYPTQVFTRAQLLDVIDPDKYTVNDRVIDAHIKNIRKKSPIPVIKTVIGLGYQYQGQADESIT